MSSTTKALTGKSWHSTLARRSFQCQRALVEGGSFFLLCLRFWRGCRHGVLRLRRVRRMRLLHAAGWLDVEPHAEHSTFPEVGGFSAAYPPPCPRGDRGHEWCVFLIDHRDKDC